MQIPQEMRLPDVLFTFIYKYIFRVIIYFNFGR